MPIKISKNRIDVDSLKLTGLREPQAATEAATKNYVDTPRVTSTASSSTPTPDASSTDVYVLTALAAGATFGAPTGSPSNGQKLVIRIKDNGTARSLSWNSGTGGYRASLLLALPTTTTVSKTLYLAFMYNSTDSKWDFLAYIDNLG